MSTGSFLSPAFHWSTLLHWGIHNQMLPSCLIPQESHQESQSPEYGVLATAFIYGLSEEHSGDQRSPEGGQTTPGIRK